MFKFILLGLLLISSSSSQVMSLKLTWDDLESGSGLHLSSRGKDKKGTEWIVRETRAQDMLFYKSLFGDIEVLRTMGPGRVVSPERVEMYVNGALGAFAQGIPTGRMTIEQEEKPVGFVHLCEHGAPGVGEVVRAFQPSSQGKGLGTEVLRFLVEDWGPTVRRVGRHLQPETSPVIAKKFQCFGGKELQVIYATARPSNPGSWQCYKHFDFHPSPSTDTTHTITCEGWEETQHGPLENYIVQKHFSLTSPDPLQTDVLYEMLDEEGVSRTLSFVEIYGSPRYHFELHLDARQSSLD